MNNKEENKMHYQPICMSIGIGLGMAIGAAFDQLTSGMCIGIGLGLAVGGVIDYVKNKKEK